VLQSGPGYCSAKPARSVKYPAVSGGPTVQRSAEAWPEAAVRFMQEYGDELKQTLAITAQQ